MDALVAAIVAEVRIRDGVPATAPVPEGLTANVKLRIRGFMRQSLGLLGSDRQDEDLQAASIGSSLCWDDFPQQAVA